MNIISAINNTLYNSGVKPSSKKASAKERMEVDEVLTPKTIIKMKQLAAEDAVKGKRGHAATKFKHQIREMVAPDRKKLFAEAEANASRNVQKVKNERPHELWEYLLELTDRLDDCSVKGQYGSDGHVFMGVFDEKRNLCGRFSSNSGWHIIHTPDEETVMNVLGKVYNDTFMEVYRNVQGKSRNAAEYAEAGSHLDVRA